jgi:hypothetical protein
MDLSDDRLQFAALLGGGVVSSGLADFALARAGYTDIGAVVWAVGYLTTMLLIWYIWVRPLDLTGPDP